MLLVESYGWLERHSLRVASTRAGLDGDELLQEVLVRYLERGEAWLAEPAHTSRTAQVRTLLKNLVRHVLTEHERAGARQRQALGVPQTEPEVIEAISLPQTTTEDALLAEEASAALAADIDALPNPMHQLLLRLVYLPSTVTAAHFSQAADKLRVAPVEGFQGLVSALQAAPDDPVQWKREVADLLGLSIDTLTRALHRARAKLQAQLEAS